MLNPMQQLKAILKEVNASKIVLRTEEQALTGNELFQKAASLAAFFKHQGVNSGDRIAIQLPNCIEFVLCYFAGILGGYTLVPINHALPQKDIEYILSLTRPRYFVKKIEDLGFAAFEHDDAKQSVNETIISIFFTSGTTNRPKGVCHTTRNMFANALAFNKLVGLNESTCMLHVMPMSYMAGFLNTVLCPLLSKGCVVIAPQFNAKEAMNFWTPAIKHNTNTMWISPTMAALLARLNRNKEISNWTKNHLSQVFVGTAPLSMTIKDLFEKVFGIECLESYGMTELMLVSSNTSQSIKTQSVGRLLEGIEIQSRDLQGNNCAPHKAGSLYIKTPFALKGYLDPDSGEIVSPLVENWFATGDYGYVDEDQHLFITGRIKDLIIRGGMNISPRSVEEKILLLPNVKEVAVIGKPHPFWGEEIVAFLILHDNKEFNQQDIIMHCRNTLHTDAIPTLFKVLDEFPRSSTGKIQTQKLRDMI